MALKKISWFEAGLIHLALLAGCLVFAFPFIWMMMTSTKVSREMSVERLRLLPLTPRPVEQTPYVASNEYDELERPDAIPAAVWDGAKAPLVEMLRAKVATWVPQTTGPEGNPPPAPLSGEAYVEEMVQGLGENLAAQISDEARQRAVNVERELRLQTQPEEEIPPQSALAHELSEAAVAAGIAAVLADGGRLVDDRMLQSVFEECYRRFALGEIRIMASDYRIHSLFTGHEWSTGGAVSLVTRQDETFLGQEVRLNFAETGREIVFEFRPAELPVPPDQIERVFVLYRMDESWASVDFEVERQGVVYQAPRPNFLYDRTWIEQELRFPGGAGSPLERRMYQVMKPAGASFQPSANTEPLVVRLRVRQNTPLGAWIAKITRNYINTFREVPYARYMMTSFSLVILNIVLAIFACTLVGYSFARLHWPGRDLCFALVLATMMIPPQVTMIPAFLIMKSLGWHNTLMPLWVPAAFGTPFFIFLLRQFFKNVPTDLEDAARMDGCGFLRIYWHVMLPLVKPTIATIAVFTFMSVWNNFMGPLIYVNDENLFPLALGLFKFNLRSGLDVSLMMAGSFMMTLPIIILFFFVQRYFIQGISLTGTKG